MNRAFALTLLGFIAMACHDDRPNTHVYSAPPPRSAAAVGAAAAAAIPDPPLGTNGPGARITSLLDAATGRPVSMTDVTGSVDIMTVVALGPAAWIAERTGLRSELVISGSRDTVLVLPLGSPPPSMVAHAFRVEAGVLGGGTSSVKVRLSDSGRVVVESSPLFLTVNR